MNIWEFMAIPPPGRHRRSLMYVIYVKKPTLRFLYSHTCEKKNLILCYDIHEAFYLNCEIHGPGSRVQAIGWGQYDHIEKMYLILLDSHIYLLKTESIVTISMKTST